MAGRKRKIPAGYIPRWSSDSDSDHYYVSRPKKQIYSPSETANEPQVRQAREGIDDEDEDEEADNEEDEVQSPLEQ